MAHEESRIKARHTIPDVPRRATLQTIADVLGVSRSTVSNAYNRPDQLAPAQDGSQRMTAIVHIPPDAEPTCRGGREVAAWEVVAVVHHRATSTWVEVLQPGVR